MQNAAAPRYRFIAHALNGDGPFRPVVSYDSAGAPLSIGQSYIVRYPRESDIKFARRNEVAFYASPLSRACARFVGYMSTRPPVMVKMDAVVDCGRAPVAAWNSSIVIV